MNSTVEREKNMEILIERLIMMIGKSNERMEHLHARIQQLEFSLQKLQNQSTKIS